MNDIEWCISYLANKNEVTVNNSYDSFTNFRALMNITMPYNLSDEYYDKQDKVLKNILKTKTLTTINDLVFKDKITIYQGDITLLKVDAIVNACNEKLLGCFSPLHGCIDNAIHSFAVLEVRRDLLEVMDKQGYDEPNGRCKVTKGYNLPSTYIFHTVGPQVFGHVNKQNQIDLANCYESCLNQASKMNLQSIAFPCISTGVYGYPPVEAANIAYKTVKQYLIDNPNSSIKYVIFNVFKKDDYETYQRIIK